ncbi:MAG: cyclic nucleotide-binding domain-containing protein [Proteobacteria bacterium]|nr:cyclic nucleotide-binding domain-containing protein [Pseudomonadota bacterium]
MQTTKRTFDTGTVIFFEGERGQHLYIVRSGRVAISRKVKNQNKILAELTEGAIFGEMALLDGGPRVASATAMEPTVCDEISIDLLRQRFDKMDAFDRALLRVLIQTIRQTLRIYDETVEKLPDDIQA